MIIRKLKVFAALCFSFPCISLASSKYCSVVSYDGPIVCEMPLRSETPCYRYVPAARRYSGVDILMFDDESFAQGDSYTDSLEIGEDLSRDSSPQSQPTESFDHAECDILSVRIDEYKADAIDAIKNAYDHMSAGKALTATTFLKLYVAYAVLDNKQKSDEMFDAAKRILSATETGRKQFESLRSSITYTIRKDQHDGYIPENIAAYIVSTFYAR